MIYKRVTITVDTGTDDDENEYRHVYVADQPDLSVLIAHNEETLEGLLVCYAEMDGGQALSREEAVTAFYEIMDRSPDEGEVPWQ